MEAAVTTVGGAILSASFQSLFGMLGSHDLLNYASRGNVEDQLKKWKVMLENIYLVLEDAEEKQMTDPLVKTWVSELRDLAYDVEDVLDEFSIEALRRKLKDESIASTSKARRFIPKLNLTTFKFNAKMISKIKKITASLEEFIKRKDALQLCQGGRGMTNQLRERQPTTTTSVLQMNEANIYGRVKDKKEILELLKAESGSANVSVLPIIGMGGVGKTTLSQLIFNDATLEFDFRAWVSVGEDFDVLKITKTIFQELDGNDENKDLNWYHMKLKEKLHQKKCLIVLDDVWNESYELWTLFCAPLQGWASESRIILTTRNTSVSSMTGTISAYFLKELSQDDCLVVFAQHALGVVNFDKHSHLEEMAKGIVRRCRGLPLAAKALGGLLRGNPNPNEWEKVLKSNIWDLPDNRCNILPALRLSYYHLPSHLKQCFAYCAIFPKDFELDKNGLVLLWMAEGFLNPPSRMQELGYQYFDDLLSRSFLQQSSHDKFRYVMHDLIHDLAQSVSKETCFHLGDKLEDTDSRAKIRHLSFIPSYLDTWPKFEEF